MTPKNVVTFEIYEMISFLFLWRHQKEVFSSGHYYQTICNREIFVDVEFTSI